MSEEKVECVKPVRGIISSDENDTKNKREGS